MADLIDRTRMAAKILRDIGGQSAMAATVDEAADALEAAGEDACVALLTDIRWACGDKGKRMQPELVEFIRELAVDAERYRWLRAEAARYKGDDPPGHLVVSVTYNPRRADGAGFTGILKTPRGDDFDAAIDTAREAHNG